MVLETYISKYVCQILDFELPYTSTCGGIKQMSKKTQISTLYGGRKVHVMSQ